MSEPCVVFYDIVIITHECMHLRGLSAGGVDGFSKIII